MSQRRFSSGLGGGLSAFWFRTLAFLLLGVVGITAPLAAQVTGAVIHGIVLDEQNAPLPNVEVTVTSTATGVKLATRTNAAGVYEFPALNSGKYELNATAQGFSNHRHTGIDLVMLQRLRVDFTMKIGTLQQTIDVVGTPTVIDTESAKASHTIGGDLVEDLPFRGRNAYMVTRLVPGANNTAAADLFANPFDTFAPSNVSINGAPVQANQATFNGVINQFGSGAVGFVPSVEGVQEATVQSFALSAEYGQSAGSVVQLESKAGTNEFHGSLYEYFNQSALNANDFFGNKFDRPKAKQNIHQFGFNIGGPLSIPKLYSGANRTFFFFNYEGIREVFGYRSFSTVPTAQQRAGDFSNTRAANGQLITIYDPYSTRFDPARPNVLIRDPLLGNRITPDRISPIATNILKYVPLPNVPGDVNNFLYTGGYTENSNSFQPRLDHQFSDNNLMYFSYGGIRREEFFLSNLPTLVTGWVYPTDSKIWTLSDTHIFSPTMTLNVRFGVSRTVQGVFSHVRTEERNALGFPQSFLGLLRGSGFPEISSSDMIGFGRGDVTFAFYRPNLRPTLTKIAGRHSLTMGYDFASYRANILNQGGEDGRFAFNRDLTQGPDASVSSATSGHGVATLLLGTPSSGSVAINANSAAQTLYHGLFIQDNWRVHPKLTLNLGLRYDYQTPVTERYNRMNRGFDQTSASPIEQQARANYGRNPIPEVPDFQVRGGLQFAGEGGDSRYNFNPKRDNWMPRLGVAWQVTPKTVLRAGYGLFFLPLMEIRGFGVGQSNLPMSQLGYSVTTSMNSVLQGRPVDTLANPFPQGLIQPIGSSQGLSTLLGQNISVYDENGRMGGSHQYQFSVQRELPSKILMDVSYVGSRVNDLPVDAPLNALPERYLALGDELNRQVPNPFEGLITVGNLSRPTVAKRQLLLPYPQFGNVNLQFQPLGRMWYNSLQASANKRLSNGLSFLLAYTWGKHMQETNFLNAYQPLETVIAPIDRTHRFVVSSEWQLPVGKSRAFGRNLPRALLLLIGDWDTTWVGTFASGQPISGFGGAIVTKDPEDISPTVDKWFDTSAFAPQPAFTNRNLSSQLSWLRFDGTNNVDLTLGKNIPIGEKVNFRLQTQFFNFFNSPQFAMPNTSVTSQAFGTVTGQANYPRWVQFSGKFMF